MFSAAPLGLALARYGRGRIVSGKREEELSEIAGDLFSQRQNKQSFSANKIKT